MRNHDQKIKDMQHFVLPSARGKRTRAQRRIIHKRDRSRERDSFSVARQIFNADIGAAIHLDFDEGDATRNMAEMVWERRARGNVGPLRNWAIGTVAADEKLRAAPLREQMAFITALMSKDHVSTHADFRVDWALDRKFHPRDYSAEVAAHAAQRAEHRDRVASDLRRILETGRHSKLNAELRRRFATEDDRGRIDPRRVRLLLGLHDVDAFTDYVGGSDSWYEVISRVAN